MDREVLWRIFEDTGSVEAYLLYRDILDEKDLPESEEPRDANIYRGGSTPGAGY